MDAEARLELLPPAPCALEVWREPGRPKEYGTEEIHRLVQAEDPGKQARSSRKKRRRRRRNRGADQMLLSFRFILFSRCGLFYFVFYLGKRFPSVYVETRMYHTTHADLIFLFVVWGVRFPSSVGV